MTHQKKIALGLFVLISLTLAGCNGSNNQTDKTEQIIEVVAERGAGKKVMTPEKLAANKELIATREKDESKKEIVKDDEGKIQRINSSEVLYAAKVGDSIEAHPAWLSVNVTLDDNIITSVDVEQQHSSPKSQRHQAQFAEQIESVVIGKTLEESNTVYLSVASSTSTAFNDAIKEIQTIYQETQV